MQHLFLKLKIRSKVVRMLKATFALLALLLITGIFILPEFGVRSKNLALNITSNDQKKLDVSNIMSKPEFYGISSDGKKYIIKALEGIEKQDGNIELSHINMLLKNNDNVRKQPSIKNSPTLMPKRKLELDTLSKLIADKAVWQRTYNHVHLYNNISVQYKGLYNLLLKVLIVDFNESTAISDQEVLLSSTNLKLHAGGLKFIGENNKALFYKPKVVLYE
jgi:hypothetical protein